MPSCYHSISCQTGRHSADTNISCPSLTGDAPAPPTRHAFSGLLRGEFRRVSLQPSTSRLLSLRSARPTIPLQRIYCVNLFHWLIEYHIFCALTRAWTKILQCGCHSGAVLPRACHFFCNSTTLAPCAASASTGSRSVFFARSRAFCASRSRFLSCLWCS